MVMVVVVVAVVCRHYVRATLLTTLMKYKVSVTEIERVG